MKYKLVMFDFDGVLVDSFEDAYATMDAVTEESLSRERYRDMYLGNIYDSKEVKEEREVEDWAENSFFKVYIPKILAMEPVAGMREVLEGLQACGVKMVVVSSCVDVAIRGWAEKNEFLEFFEGIYAVDVDTNKVRKIGKALGDVGVGADEAVFVTDTLGDVREARKADVESGAGGWGFHGEDRLFLDGEVRMVHSAGELGEILR